MSNGARFRLFISHSSHPPSRTGQSKEEKEADAKKAAQYQQLVKDVATKLGTDGYKVLLDMQCIEDGQLWRRYIHEALAECDAAVIFLTEWSLASPWVRYEATVLTERMWQDDKFKLLPIALSGMDKAKLDSGDWRPLQLREIQSPKTDDPADIVQRIEKFIGPAQRSRTPFDRMLDDIARLLEDVNVKILERACDDFGIDVEWKLHQDRSRSLADILARKVLRDESTGVAEVVRILDALKPHLRRTPAKSIVDVLEPLWVSPPAASALAIAATKKLPTVTDVALNGWKIPDFTAEQYVRRAKAFSDDWELAPVVDATPPSCTDHVKKELREWARATFPGYAKAKDDEVDRFVREKVDGLFVLLPFIPEPSEMRALRDVYKRATFVCAVSGQRPEAINVPDGMVFLEPSLSSEEIEENALSEVSKARRFVEKLPP